MAGRITDVPGVLVGCAEDREAMTGVTVVLCEDGATFACLTPGPATSTRQADAGRPEHLVQVAHAVCLAGGSAFGLGASTGVMDYLAERGAGHRVRDIVVPTVPSAVIFDRSATPGLRRPDAAMARQACASASADVPRGSVGAGCGATVGKALGIGHLMKGGQGTASIRGRDGVVVGALAVVNAFGDVLDPETGEILAGARDPEHPERLAGAANRLGVDLDAAVPSPIENTTLGVVAIAADLSKPALTRVAGMALAGFARSISPAHCVFDGDVLFLLATGGPAANENTAGHLAARALAAAVADAVLAADGFGQIPDRRTLGKTLK